MAVRPVNIGVIGCGNISSIYLEANKKFEILNIVACADIDMARAAAQAEKYGIPKACSVDELLADPTIEIVINLTIPAAHGEVGLAVLNAGKSVYNEKPLAVTREDAKQMLALAREKGLLVGGAPDTFLGGGYQTCRRLIDEGAIGTPISASAQMLSRGPEGWHPNPDFFFQPGAGPLFDMGPYYITALVSLLGPVQHVSGSTRITHPERTIGSGTRKGEKIAVNTPTHISALLEFEQTVATLVTSFDFGGRYLPRIVIYGTKGTLEAPDPNTFGGPVRLMQGDDTEWTEIPISHGYTENSRGLGVADMAEGLRNGRPFRADSNLTYHVLDVMHAVFDAATSGTRVVPGSSCERPAPLPEVWP